MIGLTAGLYAQSADNNFFVIGSVSDDLDMIQIQMRYQGDPNALFIEESETSGCEQITDAIKDLIINELHIFVRNDNNRLFIDDLALTSTNVADLSDQLVQWKNSVTGKVVIHNNSGSISSDLSELLAKMRSITGLNIELVY